MRNVFSLLASTHLNALLIYKSNCHIHVYENGYPDIHTGYLETRRILFALSSHHTLKSHFFPNGISVNVLPPIKKRIQVLTRFYTKGDNIKVYFRGLHGLISFMMHLYIECLCHDQRTASILLEPYTIYIHQTSPRYQLPFSLVTSIYHIQSKSSPSCAST